MNKVKYEKRMKELDQIAEEQQLRQRVRDRERELGLRHTRKKPAWGKAMMAVVYGLCIEIRTDRRTSGHVWSILGVCAEIRKGKHQGRHCVRHEHKAGRN